MNLGPYAVFIVAAYSLTTAVIAGLILWVLLDYRVQRKILADLETRGATRRSELPR
jgi:heme exporter protein D